MKYVRQIQQNNQRFHCIILQLGQIKYFALSQLWQPNYISSCRCITDKVNQPEKKWPNLHISKLRRFLVTSSLNALSPTRSAWQTSEPTLETFSYAAMTGTYNAPLSDRCRNYMALHGSCWYKMYTIWLYYTFRFYETSDNYVLDKITEKNSVSQNPCNNSSVPFFCCDEKRLFQYFLKKRLF
jgi:hypothetical protein